MVRENGAIAGGSLPAGNSPALRPKGVLCSSETTPPQDPTVALCLGTYGGPRGLVVSYERGILVWNSSATSMATRFS